MNNTIQKPLSVARAEFIGALADLINGSGLPFFVLEPILKDVYVDIKSLANKQYEADLQSYNAGMGKINKTTDVPSVRKTGGSQC